MIISDFVWAIYRIENMKQGGKGMLLYLASHATRRGKTFGQARNS